MTQKRRNNQKGRWKTRVECSLRFQRERVGLEHKGMISSVFWVDKIIVGRTVSVNLWGWMPGHIVEYKVSKWR